MIARRSNALLLSCALAVVGASAQAGTVALGTVTAPFSLPVDQLAPNGRLLDSFTFSIPDESTLLFSSFVESGFDKYSRVTYLTGELFRDGELLATGNMGPGQAPDGAKLPMRHVSFEPLDLGGGDYELRFSGTAVAVFFTVPVNSSYTGRIDFGRAVSIPEPSTSWLLGLGILALWVRQQGAVAVERRDPRVRAQS